MSKIILLDGTELFPLNVTGEFRYIDGFSRDVLSFAFDGNEDLHALDEAFTQENCEKIVIADNGEEYIHDGYTIRVKLSKERIEVGHDTPTEEPEHVTRVICEMARRTYMENSIAMLNEVVADLLLEV